MIDLTLIVPRLREHIAARLTDAVVTLEKGIASGAVRNVDFVKAKEAINRGVDQAYDSLDVRYEWDSGDPLVMGAWNVPAALKYALRKGHAARVELLTAMLPLHELLQSAKPLIVKRVRTETTLVPTTAAGYMTCQVCGRLIAANTGVIARHGYQRPGGGSQTRSCLGANADPYEESRARLAQLIEIMRFNAAEVEKEIADAEAGLKPIDLRVPDPSRPRSLYSGRSTKVVELSQENAIEVLANIDWDGGTPIATFVEAMSIWRRRQDSKLGDIKHRADFLRRRFDAWRKTHDWNAEKEGWTPVASDTSQDDVASSA